MKTNIKLLFLTFLLLTGGLNAKSTPLSSIKTDFFTNLDSSYTIVTPVNLIKPASMTIDEDIDFREMFPLIYSISMLNLNFIISSHNHI